MLDFINQLDEGSVKEWYKKNIIPEKMFDLSQVALYKGYKLDPKSGLYFRNPWEMWDIDPTKETKRTITDIFFMRPSNIHFHSDIVELVRVIGGKGYLSKGHYLHHENLLLPEKDSLQEIPTTYLTTIHLAKNEVHGFSPDKETGFLEINLICSRILDPEAEICVEKFDKTKIWKNLGFK